MRITHAFAAVVLCMTIVTKADALDQAEASITSELRSRYDRAVVRLETPEGWGAGFVVQNDPVLIATCHHVVKKQPWVKVYAAGWDAPKSAKWIARDVPNDLAFLKLADDAVSFPVVLKWDESAPKTLQANGRLIVAGYVYQDHSVWHGITSITPRLLFNDLIVANGQSQLHSGNNPNVLDMSQLDGQLLPGDSGGPVFDLGTKALVGLATGSVTDHGAVRFFAIPVQKQLPTTFVEIGGSDASDDDGTYDDVVLSAALRNYVHPYDSSAELSATASRDPCVESILLIRAQSDNNVAEMPKGLAGTSECQALYAKLRVRFVTEAALRDKSASVTRLAREAKWLERAGRRLRGDVQVAASAQGDRNLDDGLKQFCVTLQKHNPSAVPDLKACTAKLQNNSKLTWLALSKNNTALAQTTAEFVREGRISAGEDSYTRFQAASLPATSEVRIPEDRLTLVDPVLADKVSDVRTQANAQIKRATKTDTARLAVEVTARAADPKGRDQLAAELTRIASDYKNAADLVAEKTVTTVKIER